MYIYELTFVPLDSRFTITKIHTFVFYKKYTKVHLCHLLQQFSRPSYNIYFIF